MDMQSVYSSIFQYMAIAFQMMMTMDSYSTFAKAALAIHNYLSTNPENLAMALFIRV